MGLLDFSVDTGSAAEDPTAPLNGWLMYLFCVPSQYFNVADQEPIAAVVELEVVDLQLRLALKSEMTTTDLSPPLQVGSGVADAQIKPVGKTEIFGIDAVTADSTFRLPAGVTEVEEAEVFPEDLVDNPLSTSIIGCTGSSNM
jgi:hypothetical protein